MELYLVPRKWAEASSAYCGLHDHILEGFGTAGIEGVGVWAWDRLKMVQELFLRGFAELLDLLRE